MVNLRRLLVVCAVLSSACATTTYWRHRDSEKNFKADDYQCTRENSFLVNGEYGVYTKTDYSMWAACVQARGWYQVADPHQK